MAIFDDAIFSNPEYDANFAGYTGNPPTTKAEYDVLNCWRDKTIAPSWNDIQNAILQLQAKKQAAIDAKQSALAKLMALGLTPDEVKALLG